MFINGAFYVVGPGDLVRPEITLGLQLQSLNAFCSIRDQGLPPSCRGKADGTMSI